MCFLIRVDKRSCIIKDIVFCNVCPYLLILSVKSKDYQFGLLNKIKHKLRFEDSKIEESFMDCPVKEKD